MAEPLFLKDAGEPAEERAVLGEPARHAKGKVSTT
jgi:hypothetical protein